VANFFFVKKDRKFRPV
jgi:hypothetical protein